LRPRIAKAERTVDEEFLKALLEKLQRWRAWLDSKSTRFWLLLMIAIALLYYGSYYRHDLRFRDEGGTVALNAQRLLAGERPEVDVILNYNVLWYYPVTALFKVCGVNFVLMRVYFLALSALAAVLAFFAVTRAGRLPWLGFAVGLICVLVPGMIFKNYSPLLVIANSFVLMLTALAAPGSWQSYFAVAGGGLLLGLTFLIRIDFGFFFAVLWIGLHVLRLLDRGVAWPRKLGALLAGLMLTLGLAALVHVPVLIDAQRRGFDEPFKLQYQSKTRLIENELRARLGLPPATSARAVAANPRAESAPPSWRRDTLRRSAWQNLVSAPDFSTRAMVVLTYLPVVTIAAVLGWTLLSLGRGMRSADADDYRRPLAALVLIGGALTAFAQFFFFRPDSPHLSEFSPGYWVSVTGAALLLGALKVPLDRGLRFGHFFLLLLHFHAGLYLARMLPDRWTGTIAARAHRSQRFTAENGVDVYVAKADLSALEAICRIVREHSTPDDYLVAYPYHPTINVMTNRRTYEKDVYVDNATRGPLWDKQAIARFEKFRPAVIVLSDWEVNGHADSRFSVWAAPTKAWIQANYDFQGAYKTEVDEFEIYTRRDPSPSPAAP
jgi:hypothetical protein